MAQHDGDDSDTDRHDTERSGPDGADVVGLDVPDPVIEMSDGADVVDVTAHLAHPDGLAGSPGADDRGRDADSPFQIPKKGWKDIAMRVKDEWGGDNVGLAAAAVAFYAFLALIPALAALVSVLGLVAQGHDAAKLIDDLFGALPGDAKSLIDGQLQTISAQSSGSLSFGLLIGIALSVWSASGAIGQLMSTINIAYDEEETRSWFLRKGLALVLTLGAILFVATAIFAVVGLPVVIDRTGLGIGMSRLLNILIWPALAIMFGMALSVLYRLSPDRVDAQWKWVSVGSIFSIVAWVLVTVGFRFYVSSFGSYNKTYGSLSAVVVMLLWLWLTSIIILLGAEINAETEHQTARDTTVDGDQPMGQRGAVKADTLGRISD